MFVGIFGRMCAYVLCIPSACRAQKSASYFRELGLEICCIVPYVHWETTLDYRTQSTDRFLNEVMVAKPSSHANVL